MTKKSKQSKQKSSTTEEQIIKSLDELSIKEKKRRFLLIDELLKSKHKLFYFSLLK